MTGFNFKFEKILNYKENVENIKKSKYGALKQKLTEEEKKLESFYEYKSNLRKERNELAGTFNIGELKIFNNFYEEIKEKIEKQKQVVVEIRNEAEEAKELLIEASKEKKIYDKLKENAHNEYIYDQKKNEEKQVDSIVTYKAIIQG